MTCKMLWKKCFPKICCRMLRMKTCLLLVLLSKREEVTNFHHLCSERLNNKTRVCTHFLIVLIENWNSSESHVKEIGPWDPTTLCPCKYLQLARRTFNRISEDSFLSLRHTQVSAKIFFSTTKQYLRFLFRRLTYTNGIWLVPFVALALEVTLWHWRLQWPRDIRSLGVCHLELNWGSCHFAIVSSPVWESV